MSSQLNFIDKNSLWSRIVRAYQVDPKKYQRKGYGKFVGYILLIMYFFISPLILKQILKIMLDYVPHKIIPAIGIVFLNVLILTVYNSIMYFIYKGKYQFFQKYRVNEKSWPWEENYDEWIKLLKKSIKCVFVNNVIIGGPIAIIDCLLTDFKYSLDEIPTTRTILWQFIIFMLIEDFAFYIAHSTFHRPQFYWIHKQHHQYNTTVTIAAEYAHPIESILGNALPIFLGFKILAVFYPVHAISMWTFFVFRIIETCDGHSGYQWSFALSELFPFSAGSAYHNFHHSHNVGNYSSFFKFWDTVFSTNTQYLKFRQNRQIVSQEQKTK